ncbi:MULTISPECIES: phage holin family protein [Pseudoalteromonas]|uniref:phage holin family protein n=1 Tax=Pseudoalteromonas TaxID=53246 RepID=UPI000FFE4200|nr:MULTISPECIES: phage holin family protein [Pseudoalteromonas]NKC19384.1 hypothetical protein [Pseudoalteromonas galatheae]RXE86698.1 hypothetical protein DRB05_10705 [Pseudoalteromonas sp. A757]
MQDQAQVRDRQAAAHERTPALAELKDSVSLLINSYQQIAEAQISLLGAKFRANLKTLCIALGLILFSLILTAMVWGSLHALFAYALTYAGLSWFISAGIVLTINIAVIYYLIVTGLKLFNNSINDLTSGFFTPVVKSEASNDETR